MGVGQRLAEQALGQHFAFVDFHDARQSIEHGAGASSTDAGPFGILLAGFKNGAPDVGPATGPAVADQPGPWNLLSLLTYGFYQLSLYSGRGRQTTAYHALTDAGEDPGLQ